MRELLLATTNPAKAAQLAWVFEELGLTLRALPADAAPGPDEEARTFLENAETKARFWSVRYDCLAAASDGGLVIPALGERWDALRTARAAGPSAGDVQRAEHLLAMAVGLSGAQREVYWLEALAVARRGRLLASWSARGARAVLVESFEPERLRPGFWAASLCLVPERGLTLAELPADELGRASGTWSALREHVRDLFPSGQADL